MKESTRELSDIELIQEGDWIDWMGNDDSWTRIAKDSSFVGEKAGAHRSVSKMAFGREIKFRRDIE